MKSPNTELQNPELLIQGDIKFSVPSVVCQLLANHWTSEYIIKNPMARVEIKSQELFEFNHDVKNFDHVALQYGNIQRPELVHRELSSVELISCASPEYIKKFNTLDRPDNFEGHTLLMVDNCNLKDNMIFSKGDETVSLDNRNPLIQHLYCYFMYRYRPATGSLTENIFHLCLLCFLHLGELQLLFY